MRTNFRTTLQFTNQTGTLSSPGDLDLQVHFDLIEMEDVDGQFPRRRFGYGNLRFQDRLESSVVSMFLSKSRLILKGGGIQADVRFYSLNSFSITSSIKVIRTSDEGAAAKSHKPASGSMRHSTADKHPHPEAIQTSPQ